MAIDQLIKRGDKALDDKDYLGAISLYSDALNESPTAFQALLKRAIAFQRLKNYDAAKRDISEAHQVAHQRGRRADIGLCYFRLGLIFYAERDFAAALTNLEKAKEHDCQESTLENWLAKARYDVGKQPLAPAEAPLAPTPAASRASSHIDTINTHAPLKPKFRDDWYQNATDVTITLYAKNISRDALRVVFTASSVAISFPTAANAEFNYNLDPLYGEIVPDECAYKVYATKLEVTLRKRTLDKWATLERLSDANVQSDASVYPSSSKKAVNWSKFKVDEDDEADASENDFFAKLYKDTDDDTRRAMMKSYVESNGTVLTTNWDEAKQKKFETSPPEGMVAKEWQQR